jgi:hypothetical protein
MSNATISVEHKKMPEHIRTKESVEIRKIRESYGEKRGCERIPAQLFVSFFDGDSLRNGFVTDLSSINIYFTTGANLSSGSNIEVLIPLKYENMIVPVNIIRTEKIGNLTNGFGAELLSPSLEYIDFIFRLRSAL